MEGDGEGPMMGQLTKIFADVSFSSADWGEGGGGVARGGAVVSKRRHD